MMMIFLSQELRKKEEEIKEGRKKGIKEERKKNGEKSKFFTLLLSKFHHILTF